MAERTGVPLAYETDVDLDQHPGLLAGARAVISLGHDEYYSLAMRNALVQARDAGTNLAFLGANAIYRHIRFAAGTASSSATRPPPSTRCTERTTRRRRSSGGTRPIRGRKA